MCHDLDYSVWLYAPIAYGFLKSSPNKNTTTAINDRVVVCNPRIESDYPGMLHRRSQAIKRMRGITLSKEMMRSRGCTVRLRHECECGRDGALELLLKYNREDVANLETIIELRAS